MTVENRKILNQLFIEKKIPVFYTATWLDTVCIKGSWGLAVARNKAGEIDAVMPYHLRKKYGISALLMPKLTPYGGILFFPPSNMVKLEKLNSFKKKASNKIIKQLPKVPYFNAAFHPSFDDWQPFMWDNYRQRTRYTYQISHSKSLENVWQGLNSKVRNHISTAQKSIIISESEDVHSFFDMNKESFIRQEINPPYDASFLVRIYKSVNAAIPGSVKIIFGQMDGKIHGGIMTIHDNNTVYCLATGLAEFAHRGTMSLLIWDAIKKANRNIKDFDFEGSDLPKVESFFRAFGGSLTPYFQISKAQGKIFQALLIVFGKL